MLDSLLTVNTVSGSTGTSGQNAGGMGVPKAAETRSRREAAVRAPAARRGVHGRRGFRRCKRQRFAPAVAKELPALLLQSGFVGRILARMERRRGAFVLASLDGEAKLPTVSTNISTNTGSGWNTTYTWSGYDLIGTWSEGFVNGRLSRTSVLPAP